MEFINEGWNYFLIHAAAFSALATFTAALSAIIFGVFGNRQLWLLMRASRKRVDNAAFRFLCDIPFHSSNFEINCSFIQKFEEILSDNNSLSSASIKRYRSYIRLAELFFNKNDKKKTFYSIFEAINRIKSSALRKEEFHYFAKFLDYEDEVFCDKRIIGIFRIYPDIGKTVKVLVYTDIENINNEEKIFGFFKNGFKLVSDDEKNTIDKSFQSPSKIGQIIERNSERITLRKIEGEIIILKYDTPIRF